MQLVGDATLLRLLPCALLLLHLDLSGACNVTCRSLTYLQVCRLKSLHVRACNLCGAVCFSAHIQSACSVHSRRP